MNLDLPLEPIINGMSLSPDGKLLALWATKVGSGFVTRPSSTPGYEITRIGRISGQLAVYDASTLKPLDAATAQIHEPRSVCFSPDSRYLLVPDKAKGVVVYAQE